MWNPEKIIITNFRSFEYQEYSFETGAFLVQGINRTNVGQKSNGSGKSAFREAVSYALDLPVYAALTTDLIRYGAKFCRVTFVLTNKDDILEITRETPLKGSSTLEIMLNKESLGDRFATVPEGNKLIIELIGISKEDLLNHYIISSEKYTSIFSTSDTKVKNLIGRFSQFNKIDGVEKLVEADIGVLDGHLTTINSEKDKLLGRLEVLEEDLVKEQALNEAEIRTAVIGGFTEAIGKHNESIKGLNFKIDGKNKRLKEIETLVEEKAKAKADIQIKVDTFKGKDYTADIEEVKGAKISCLEQKGLYDEKVQGLNISLREFTKFKEEVDLSIAGSIACPKCMHEFVHGEEVDVEEARKTLPQVVKEIETINESLSEQALEMVKIDQSITDLNKKFDTYQDQVDKIRKEKSGYEQAINTLSTSISGFADEAIEIAKFIELGDASIKNYNGLIKDLEANIKEAEGKHFDTREKELTEAISGLNFEIEVKDKAYDKVKGEAFDKGQWIHRFKKFRSFLANESLEIIQGYSNMYLEQMGSDMSLQLEGYKQNANGDIREKITPIVLRNGEKFGSGSIKNYSRGERARLDVTTSILSLQDLINNSCPTGGLNMLLIDEVLEGVDGLGLELLVKEIHKLQKYCLIISHTTHEGVPDNILTIEKVNGISKIV